MNQNNMNNQTINTQQAQIWLRKYREQMDLANSVGHHTPEGQKHLEEATRIKVILSQFTQRVQSRQAQAGGVPGPGQAGAQPQQGMNMNPTAEQLQRALAEALSRLNTVDQTLAQGQLNESQRANLLQEQQKLKNLVEQLRSRGAFVGRQMQNQSPSQSQPQPQQQQQQQHQQQHPQQQQNQMGKPGPAGMMQRTNSATPLAGTSGPSARPSPPNHAATAQAMSTQQRAAVPTLPIPQTLNVSSPAPVTMKQGRPTLTGGGPMGSQVMSSPALYKVPPVEIQGDRVLTKRKLSELVASVVGDEKEAAIDGDVEEILLDMADEFVTSVTSFACRLAKHRRSDTLEARDIQLHLEQNWNLRVPGYASDEIRSIRKIAPTPAYVQKVNGVNMSRAVGR